MNPAAPRPGEIESAMQAFENFTGARVTHLDTFKVSPVRAAWAMGPVSAISYIAERDGQTFEFIHTFKPNSRPLLAASDDGLQLLILGGEFSVTDRGIVDAA